MPKKYTKTEDGWTRVEEYDESQIEINSSELYKNNYYHKYQEEQKKKMMGETIKIGNSMPELEIENKPQAQQQVKQHKVVDVDNRDWEKEADRAAMFGALAILGFAGLIAGILALIVYFSPNLTWQNIGEAIAFGVLQVIYYMYKIFYSICVALFEWIFKMCGGQW